MSGHPAKQDPHIRQLHKLMKQTMNLVGDFQQHRPNTNPAAMVHIQSSALGLMAAYDRIAGLPTINELKDTP